MKKQEKILPQVKTMEVEGEWRLNKLNEIAKERCPGYYCVTHEIFPEIKIIKQ